MAGVAWVKITTDMFDHPKIKHLRRREDGNSIVLIWVMLLTMAGRCNAGGTIFLTETIPYTTEILAEELGFDENVVVRALKALNQLNMIETDGACFRIAGWEEYQNVEGLERIREQNRLRKQKQRERKKLLACDSRVTVTDSHAPEEERESDIKNIRNKNNHMGDPADTPELKRSTRKVFVPPTAEEVRAYCTERGNSIDPEAFVDFYASKGWMIGKNKMKDWKAAVRTWEQGDKRKGVKNGGGNRQSLEESVAGRIGTWL